MTRIALIGSRPEYTCPECKHRHDAIHGVRLCLREHRDRKRFTPDDTYGRVERSAVGQ